MSDPHDLARFVDGQASCYARVLSEMRAGRKTSHWIWFVFPQLRGLGQSERSSYYGIRSVEEAAAYAGHPLLGPRLVECVDLVMAAGATPALVLGSLDATKLFSCLTLFGIAAPATPIFGRALATLFDGRRDERTLELLAQAVGRCGPASVSDPAGPIRER